MNKCLRITLIGEPKDGFLRETVQKIARKYDLEGFGQPVDDKSIKIIICGEREKVDAFVDLLHKESFNSNIEDIEIEPFLKDKDYRGIFRIVE